MPTNWADLLTKAGIVLGNAAGQRATGLGLEGQLQNAQNNSATSRYQALVNASRLKNVEQPSANLSQAGQGSLMSTWQPVSVGSTPVPYGTNTNGPVRNTISGGPSITPEMRGTGDSVAKAAMARQLAGNTMDTSLFPSDSALGLGEMPQSSWLDKLLGYGSLATTGASLIPGLGGAPAETLPGASSITPGASTPGGAGGGGMSDVAKFGPENSIPNRPALGGEFGGRQDTEVFPDYSGGAGTGDAGRQAELQRMITAILQGQYRF